jgi:hypothetical protein
MWNLEKGCESTHSTGWLYLVCMYYAVTVITTVVLFFAGAGVFLLLEYDNPETFGGMDAWDTTFQAFFLSAMTRSGGFSVVDIGELNGYLDRLRNSDTYLEAKGLSSLSLDEIKTACFERSALMYILHYSSLQLMVTLF